jgi:hypothetical protein
MGVVGEMAEKRMFTQKIIDSDAFLDMPLSAQALYFHLNMRADDDGFVNNPKRIQRTIGAADDDLKLLCAKRFVIGFESGVIVIKHWRMHNTLRKDRYNPTQYQEELALLDVKDNNAYTERCLELPEAVATTWQPIGNQMATQNSIGKISIDKFREEGVEIIVDDPPAPPKKKNDIQQIVDLYHSICISFPKIRSVSASRAKAIRARLNTYSIDDFRTLFENAEASSFLKGSNDRNWTATFDWLIKDANMAKVLEGNYADKGKPTGRKEKLPGWFNKPFEVGNYELENIRQVMSEADQEEAEQLRRELQESFGRKE